MNDQERLTSADIIELTANKITENETKVFVTPEEKASIANKAGIYYPQHSLIVSASLPSAITYNDYECAIGNLIYHSNGVTWTLLTALDQGTFFFDQDSNLYQVSQLEGANNKIMFATKAAIESLLTGEITTHTHTPYPQTDLATASGTITLATNTVTNLTNAGTGTFTIAFGAATANKANDYGFILRIGGTLRTINWDAGIVWKDGTAPTLAINKTYYFVSSKLGSQYLTAFNTF